MEYRLVSSDSALQRVEGMAFRWSINPYRGCRHACRYCYARVYHRYAGFADPADFDRVVLVKRDLPAVLGRELRRRRSFLKEPVAIGTATDPYQPIEAREGITRRLLEVLLDYGAAVTITTKSPLVLRDLDLLRSFAAYGGIRVHLTVTVLDEVLWRLLEPRAAKPSARLQAVADLAQAHIPVGVFVAPIIPELGEGEALAVLDAAGRAGSGWAWFDLLRLSPVVRSWLLPRLAETHPETARRLARLYGDRDSLPPRQRARILAPIAARAQALGLAGKVPPPTARQPLEFALFS